MPHARRAPLPTLPAACLPAGRVGRRQAGSNHENDYLTRV